MDTLADAALDAANAAYDTVYATTADADAAETAFKLAYALSSALQSLDVHTPGMDYDAMQEALATQADLVTSQPQRAEEVTRNCHVIARSLARRLKTKGMTTEQRAHAKQAIVYLHDCAAEHDGAEDWLSNAAVKYAYGG